MTATPKSSAFYKRFTKLYVDLKPDQSKSDQISEIDYIWSKVRCDKKKIKNILTVLQKRDNPR